MLPRLFSGMHPMRNGMIVRALTLPTGTAIVCGLLAVASFVDARWLETLDYHRSAIAAGEAWRLVTAHAMHLSASHAALDISAMLLVAWIFAGRAGPGRQAALGFFAIVVIDAGLWWFRPEVDRYVGLSGVLHAGFAAGAIGWSATPSEHRGAVAKRAWGAALLAALAIKLYLETRQQAFWLAGDPFPVVTAAHRWGALAGLLAGAATVRFDRREAVSRAPPRGSAGAASRGRRSRAR